MRTTLILAFSVLILSGCASPEPVLYPNRHLSNVGQAAADRDIAGCIAMAENHGASSKDGAAGDVAGSTAVGGGVGAAVGVVGGAIVGSAGRGAAVGAATGATAGLIRGLFKTRKPSPVHKKFVNKCLRDRGYEPIGWK
jgi:Glycine-zipper domain